MSIEVYVIQINFCKINAKVQFCLLVKNLFDEQYENLNDAYRNAIYKCLDPRLILRIGVPHPGVDQWLQSWAVETLCILTAYNPVSKVHTDAYNKYHHKKLMKEVTQKGFLCVNGINCDPEGIFPDEATCWIPGMTRDEGKRTALEYHQNAFVFKRIRVEPMLIWVK